MGYAEYKIRIAVSEGDGGLKKAIAQVSGLTEFSFAIINKSLDARKKYRIEWEYRVAVTSPGLKGGHSPQPPGLVHESVGGSARIGVIGSGPAGIFAAAYLARSGFKVTVFERGGRVEDRRSAIASFEGGGGFPTGSNYAFGEGGAGTFSDGKLSSRSKGINAEQNYIFAAFISAGAPPEIAYMTHPHLGSDTLFSMTRRMRETLTEEGVEFRFDTEVKDLLVKGDSVRALVTDDGVHEVDHALFACGHSAYETYRMLMDRGVSFQPKNFAIGFRAEHEQRIINRAQWGQDALTGVKAAEYRLTAQAEGGIGVYSFCMCPGGTIVPASAYPGAAVVNGKSDYARDGRWANSAVVAGLSLPALLGREVSAKEALDWLDALERRYYDFSGGYRAPAMSVRDFLSGGSGASPRPSSYPLGLVAADLGELLPPGLVTPLRTGLRAFCAKLRGYDEGQLLGLESKTSSAIQALRHPESLNSGYANLYVAGEGSGWSGGIVSSAADGLRVAQALCRSVAGK